MTTVVGGNYPLNFNGFDYKSLLLGVVASANAGEFITADSGIVDTFTGTFQYLPGSFLPVSGFVTGIRETIDGVFVFQASDFSLNIDDFRRTNEWVVMNLWAGNDSIRGSSAGDYLLSYSADDTLQGWAETTRSTAASAMT